MAQVEITQSVKRATLENDRKVREGATYHSYAQSSVNDERGGRFAAADKQVVTGSSPYSFPRISEASPWAVPDQVGTEPPLGYNIDEQPTTGETFEVEASMQSASSPPADDAPAPPVSGSPTARTGGASKFRRRA